MDDDDAKATPQPAASAEAIDEIESRRGEMEGILENGPRQGNRSGAYAFLALVVILGAAAHFHFASRGGDAYLQRLDAELLNHAELSLAAMDEGGRLAIAPSWPLGLYENLRRDILVYCALAALAAYAWSLASRAHARRDAFIVHEQLASELADLRARLDRVDPDSRIPPPSDPPIDRKG
jgi:hypothetical protein